MSDRIVDLVLAVGVVAFVTWVAACGDGAVEPPRPDLLRPATVTVTPASAALTEIGSTVQVTAKVHDQNMRVIAGAGVTWTSSDATVASVDASGLVTVAGQGTATITATAGSGAGAATVTVAQVPGATDREALVALYEATDGPNWRSNSNWLTDAPLDEWYGVDTDDSGRVVTVNLSGGYDEGEGRYVRQGLVGPIPRELANLTELRILRLDFNALTGPIPPELGNLSRLAVLGLWVNALDGPIPPEIGKLNGLRELNIGNNLLSGPIPPELASLTSLERLDLGNSSGVGDFNIYDGSLSVNRLTGPIPPELGNLANLWYLSLGSNQLTGAIPAELGNLVNLGYLTLRGNRLTGPIPPELGNLVNLQDLNLGDNQLSGRIPEEFGNLANIRRFELSYNRLNGSIPAGIGRIASLRRLYLSQNQLAGPLPQSFLGLHLEYLRIRGNPGLCVSGTAAFGAWLGDLSGHDADEVDPCNAVDMLALNTLHAATGGSGWTRSDGWASERPVEEWYGVEADSLGMVVGLDLTDNNVVGDLPSSLANLVALRELRLTGNRVTGRLPLGFASLPLYTVLVEPTVCAPSEAAFQSWWATVPTKIRLPACAPLSERDLLVAVYHALGGDGWHRNDNWLSDEPLSTWYGVETTSGTGGRGAASRRRRTERRPDAIMVESATDMLLDSASLEEELADLRSRWEGVASRDETDGAPTSAWAPVQAATDGSVVALDLADNGLAGRIPAEIGYLSNLERLDLFYNDLSGPVPSTLGSLGALSFLSLQANDLSGPIPPELGNLSRLTYASFQANRLEGRIPPELGNLNNLEDLNLSFNQLRGPFPPELGNLLNMDRLNLDHALRGGGAETIPAGLGNLANLSYLSLVGNNLSGPIPSELAQLANLRTLRLWLNGLTGPIPPELGRLSRLERLELGRNELTGIIPPELGNLSNLESFGVTGNQLSGPIPPEFGRLTNLKILALGGNDLSGSIPSELGSRSSSLEEIYLWGNSFEGGFGSSFGNLPHLKVLYAPDAGFSGPVPPSFGQLSALEWLYLAKNREMAGELPSTLTAIDKLDRFLVGGTGLCAPGDPAFRAWLEGVTMQHGVSECGHGIVARAYLVQAVQSARDPVPLVEGRDALLRVFVTAGSAVDVIVPPVRASFYNDGALVHTVDIAALDAPIASEPAERSLTASSNAEIPGAAILPGLEMVVEIDPGGTLDPALGIAKRIPEAGRLALDIREVPPFEVTVVPFVRNGREDRAALERIQGLTADDPLFHDTQALLPVNDMTVAVRDPVLTSTNDMFVLLRELDALRVTDGAPGYYMGTLAGEWSPNSPGGVALAVPSRSQMSRLDGSKIAHEFGHNLHLYHAPCGNPWNTDTGYPHEQGTIGAWGYDFATGSLVNPRQADLMTYCDPAWVSPYHFSNALRWRRKSEASTQAAASVVAERMLLLWGGAAGDGALALEPAFLFDGQPSLPDSGGDWRVSGEASDGSELFALDFHMAEVADGDGRRSFVFAIPGNISWAGRLARIVLASPERETSIESDRETPLAVLRDAATGRIRGFLRDPGDAQALTRGEPPALASLGVDPERIEVTVSRGVPRASDWRR